MSVIDKALADYFKCYPVPPGSVIGVAVSGGADSLCLTQHLSAYARKNNLKLMAATVDHGLRCESTEEAEQVHALLSRKKIPHTILCWTGQKPKTRIEEKAREKRYELLSKWCQDNQIQYLFLAHHQGDQAETFWARLARGSGVNGLSAMSEQTEYKGIYLCRPLLHLSKSVFETDLRAKQILWFEDKMNQDDSYERVRWRHQQKSLSELGLTPAVLDKATSRLARARQALDFYTRRFEQALADVSPQGYAAIDEQAVLSVPAEIRLRVIQDMLKTINPDVKSVSLDALEQWLNDFPRLATLGGCVLVRQKGFLFIARESSRMAKPVNVTPNAWTSWDRFDIYATQPISVTVGTTDKNLPYEVRKSIPSVQSAKDVSIYFDMKPQKGLEKKFTLDYKKKKSDFVLFVFKGAS